MFHQQLLTTLMLVAGPLRAVAIECYLPTQAEHGWQGIRSMPHPLCSLALSYSSGVSSTKVDQAVPSSEADSLPLQGMASPLA